MPNAYQHLSGVPYTDSLQNRVCVANPAQIGNMHPNCDRSGFRALEASTAAMYGSEVLLGRSKPQSLAYGPVNAFKWHSANRLLWPIDGIACLSHKFHKFQNCTARKSYNEAARLHGSSLPPFRKSDERMGPAVLLHAEKGWATAYSRLTFWVTPLRAFPHGGHGAA